MAAPRRQERKIIMSEEIVQTREMEIINQLGLHARAAAAFVKVANRYGSEITVQKESVSVNGKSIMGVLMLAAAQGSKIIVEAKGDDAVEALDALSQLVNEKFGESQ
jgi:phosphocarrier protein